MDRVSNSNKSANFFKDRRPAESVLLPGVSSARKSFDKDGGNYFTGGAAGKGDRIIAGLSVLPKVDRNPVTGMREGDDAGGREKYLILTGSRGMINKYPFSNGIWQGNIYEFFEQ